MVRIKGRAFISFHLNSDPCKATRCPYYSICLPYPNSELGYKCACPSGCSKTISQVCGSDGRTYDNECVMQQTACASKTMITLVKLGTCGMYFITNYERPCCVI